MNRITGSHFVFSLLDGGNITALKTLYVLLYGMQIYFIGSNPRGISRNNRKNFHLLFSSPRGSLAPCL